MSLEILRTTSFFKLTEQAWRRTANLLFLPFRLGVWWKLLLIAFVSGQLVSGWAGFGGPNLNWSREPEEKRTRSTAGAVEQDVPPASAEGGAVTEAGKQATEKSEPVTYKTIKSGLEAARGWIKQHAAIPIIVLLLVIAWQGAWAWLA